MQTIILFLGLYFGPGNHVVVELTGFESVVECESEADSLLSTVPGALIAACDIVGWRA